MLLESHSHLTDIKRFWSSAVSGWWLEIPGQMAISYMVLLSLGNWSKTVNADRFHYCKIQFILTVSTPDRKLDLSSPKTMLFRTNLKNLWLVGSSSV